MTSAQEQAAQAQGLGVPHHLGFVVDDLEHAALHWHGTAGVGPFLVLPHVRFDELAVHGRPARFDHTRAFAVHGPLFIELQIIHRVDPVSALDSLNASGPAGLHHVGYVVDDLAAQSARLACAGLPRTVVASTEGLDIVMHDATPLTGATIELHRESPRLRSLFDRVRSLAEDWDGRELLIEAPAPTTSA